MVALATGTPAPEAGLRLEAGIGRVEPPQGVTVVAGPPGEISHFVSGPLLAPGTDLPSVLRALPALSATGFLSSAVEYFPESGDGASMPVPAIPAEDLSLWEAVEDLDTPAAYRVYLDRFPQGAFAAVARARLETAPGQGAPGTTAQAQAELAEAALGLTRNERRELQRYLTILGHDTRGVDGIFGPATRRALRSWQEARGYPASGFLDARQVAALREAGEDREADLAEERAAREQADRAWWQATGAGRTVEGMRAYLERYPEGIYAERALAAIEEATAGQAWERARSLDTIAGYREFLETYPESRHATAARARLDELQTGLDGDERARLEAREAALNLPPLTRMLVEQRLARLGLEPGQVDGEFDASTRRAIADYQGSRGLPATGYLDQSTIALLLAGSLGEILR
jgi:peptidoglycan hydrolase-like protein with peptidoglycan-binding domain